MANNRARMRVLNDRTPQSSFATNPNDRAQRPRGPSLTIEQERRQAESGHAPKRQKIGSDHAIHTSRFFGPRPPKGPPEPIYDDLDGDRTVLDLTEDNAHEPKDTIEIASTSSTGRVVTNAAVNEYRTTTQRTETRGTKRRQRRKKNNGDDQSSRDPHSPGSHFEFPSPRGVRLTGSPDHLASNEPPPANIVSDVATTKRGAPSKPLETANKRVKTGLGQHINSEDELSRQDHRAGKRSNNFSNMRQPTKPSLSNRGDIRPTIFGETGPTRPIACRPAISPTSPPIGDVQVVKAASGKWFFSSEESEGIQVTLKMDRVQAKTMHKSPLDLGWIDIARGRVNSFTHATTNSEYIIIDRPITAGSPGKIALRLNSPEEALRLTTWLREGSTIPSSFSKSPAELERIVEKMYNNAVDYDQKVSTAKARSNGSVRTFIDGVETASVERDPFRGGVEQHPDKLKDKMLTASRLAPMESSPRESVSATQTARAPNTRRTRRSSPLLEVPGILPDRWSALHPEWEKKWKQSLVFPPTGKNRATVDKHDIPRLDEGEFLNDNLINFYVRYLQDKLQKENPDILQRLHFFSTFFFEKLRQNRGKINYDGVKAWTSKTDLFDYPYIFVPVNENAHWYLVIIYNAPQLLPKAEDTVEKKDSSDQGPLENGNETPAETPKLSTVENDLASVSLDDPELTIRSESSTGTVDLAGSPTKEARRQAAKPNKRPGGLQRFSPELPKIITLDSLGSSHSPTCNHLKEYLIQEAKHKKGIDITPGTLGMTGRHVPGQDNFCDCGVFVLGYLEEILKNPGEVVRKLLQKEELGWDIKPTEIRNRVRDLIFELHREQDERHQRELEEKRKRKAAKAMAVVEKPPVLLDEPPSLNVDNPKHEAGKDILTNGFSEISADMKEQSSKPHSPPRRTPTPEVQPKMQGKKESAPLISLVEDSSCTAAPIRTGKAS